MSRRRHIAALLLRLLLVLCLTFAAASLVLLVRSHFVGDALEREQYIVAANFQDQRQFLVGSNNHHIIIAALRILELNQPPSTSTRPPETPHWQVFTFAQKSWSQMSEPRWLYHLGVSYTGNWQDTPALVLHQVVFVFHDLTVLTMALLAACSLRWADRRLTRPARRRAAGLCGRCGYDLRASPGRCPECGEGAPAAAITTPAGAMP